MASILAAPRPEGPAAVPGQLCNPRGSRGDLGRGFENRRVRCGWVQGEQRSPTHSHADPIPAFRRGRERGREGLGAFRWEMEREG